MTHPAIQFLRNRTLKDLETVHQVEASICQVTGVYVSLNYSQITSRFDNPVSNQCRGVILAERDGRSLSLGAVWEDPVVLARPMDRFFNQGQPGAADLDFSSPHVQVQEKLDGTFTQVWWNPIQEVWEVATRSVPKAHLLVDGCSSYTFAGLFDAALERSTNLRVREDLITELERIFRVKDPKSYTWMFELITPFNQVVVNYSSWRLSLLAVRDTQDGTYLPISDQVRKDLQDLGCAPPEVHHPRNLQDLKEWVNSRDFKDHEGVVVVDTRTWNRVKIKSDQYVLRPRTRFSASPRNLLELCLQKKEDDIAGFLLEHQLTLLAQIKTTLSRFCEFHDRQFQEVLEVSQGHGASQRKVFAMEAQSRKVWLEPLIQQFTQRASSTREWIDNRVRLSNTPTVFLDKILDWGYDQGTILQ